MEVEHGVEEVGGASVAEVTICHEIVEDTAASLQEDHVNEAASEDSGMSSVVGGDTGGQNSTVSGGLLIMPTSPISVTTASMSASDDMIENENEMLRDRSVIFLSEISWM